MTSHKPQPRQALAAVACAALLFALPACAQSTAVTPAAAGSAPVKVEKNATTGIAKLTLTEQGLARIQLKTVPVAAGAGTDVLLPYASLLYDASGKTWVYTNPAPQVFERQAVTVSKVESGVVTATKGPAVGTPVVTVGAVELFGAELNTGK
jgi:ABC-type oligopeptide transport system substrate-binding subunit